MPTPSASARYRAMHADALVGRNVMTTLLGLALLGVGAIATFIAWSDGGLALRLAIGVVVAGLLLAIRGFTAGWHHEPLDALAQAMADQPFEVTGLVDALGHDEPIRVLAARIQFRAGEAAPAAVVADLLAAHDPDVGLRAPGHDEARAARLTVVAEDGAIVVERRLPVDAPSSEHPPTERPWADLQADVAEPARWLRELVTVLLPPLHALHAIETVGLAAR
ncbi:MAG: hypothetical protein R2939_09510 [Kofleriaceae bacterium]